MADIEKKLNARIVLKHDTLANWERSGLVLKEGEVAVAVKDGGYYEMRVGDGVHTWKDSLKLESGAGSEVTREEFEELKGEVEAELSGKVETLSAAAADLAEVVEGLTQDVEATQTALSGDGEEDFGLSGKVADLSGEVETLTDDVAALQTAVSGEGGLSGKVESLEEAVKDISGLSGVLNLKAAFTNADKEGRSDRDYILNNDEFKPLKKGDVFVNTDTGTEWLVKADGAPAGEDDLAELGSENAYAGKQEFQALKDDVGILSSEVQGLETEVQGKASKIKAGGQEFEPDGEGVIDMGDVLLLDCGDAETPPAPEPPEGCFTVKDATEWETQPEGTDWGDPVLVVNAKEGASLSCWADGAFSTIAGGSESEIPFSRGGEVKLCGLNPAGIGASAFGMKTDGPVQGPAAADVSGGVRSLAEDCPAPSEGLFAAQGSTGWIRDASGLALPEGDDFSGMFYNQALLEKGPLVPDGSNFAQMFYGCANVRDLSVDWTEWPACGEGANPTYRWLGDAGSEVPDGVEKKFTKKSGLQVPERGDNGVPDGWTIVDRTDAQ